MKTIGKSTSVLESTANRNDGAMRNVLVGYLLPLPHSGSPQVNRFGHRAHQASTVRVEHRKLPKSMMIEKALLSGL